MSSLTRLFAFPLLIKLWGKAFQIFCLFLHLREAASASKPRLALLRWFQVVEGDTARLTQGAWRVLYYRWFPHQGGFLPPRGHYLEQYLVIPGDVFGCHPSWEQCWFISWVEARDAASAPDSLPHSYQAQNVNSVAVKSCVK